VGEDQDQDGARDAFHRGWPRSESRKCGAQTVVVWCGKRTAASRLYSITGGGAGAGKVACSCVYETCPTKVREGVAGGNGLKRDALEAQ
jgi:hypothetical protein